MRSLITYANTRCALGDDLESCVGNLLAGEIFLQQQTFDNLQDPVTLPYYALADLVEADPERRVYQLLQEMLSGALQKHPLTDSARKRTGLFLGSSSFDVNASEALYRKELTTKHDAMPMPIIGYGKLVARLREKFGLGPHTYTYSTACTSSANALLNAHRLLQAGLIDHALIMGVELFNHTTLLGFYGLGLISPSARMRPFDSRRDGLILGEGCGVIMLSRTDEQSTESGISFCGGATATDNYSLTAANTDGSTIATVSRQALKNCGLAPNDLAAIKAHGTASLMNDEAEAAGIQQLYPQAAVPPLFALKPYIGHTLGACGLLETALVLGCLERRQLPSNPSASAADEDLGVRLLKRNQAVEAGYYGLNFFAFGGNNSCLILHKAAS